MTDQQLVRMAEQEGFAAAAIMNTEDMEFDPSFRAYCQENLCGKYGVNYCCPPDCGSTEEMKQRVLAHQRALVLQSICGIADFSDAPALKKGKNDHNMATVRLVKKLRTMGQEGVIVGAGGCSLCSPCAITRNEPCRYPSLRFSCMSAYCIFVRKLAEHCGMEYDCGPGLVAFFGMYLLD